MSGQSDADKLAYVLTVLKHTELPQPNYHDVATEAGINNANNAQKRFKAIVEGVGFSLVNKQIRSSGDISTPAASPTARKTKATKPKKAKTNSSISSSSAKKRKIAETEQHGSEGEDVVQGSADEDKDED